MCCDLPLDKNLDIFKLKSTKFIVSFGIIYENTLFRVDMFDQAIRLTRVARVSMMSTEGMVVGAAGLIINI